MKYLTPIALAIALAMPATQRNYLTQELTSTGFKLTSSEVVAWRASYKQRLQQEIAALPDSVKNPMISRANRAMNFAWPRLESAVYKDLAHPQVFQQKQTDRRSALYGLAIGEVITHDPKYLPSLISGLKATIVEDSWVLPQHADVKNPDFIDLSEGGTAADLAAIIWMLSDEINQASPTIIPQIQGELSRRLWQPYINHNDMWWMGFGNGTPNNWNTWINADLLRAALYTFNNADTLNLLISKIAASTDKLINGYGEDGGCPEGPEYWSAAGGKLIRIIQTLSDVSGGQLTWKNQALIHRMGSYINKMHIGGSYYVDFEDAPPRMTPLPESVYAYGAYFGDDTLKSLAAQIFSLQGNAIIRDYMNDFLIAADYYQILASTPQHTYPSANTWYPDLQILTARSPKLFLGAQAGSNQKSHNHNDVGNFILYSGGEPVIVDAGVGSYNAITFSKDRYTLWNLRSLWHNVPYINGVEQKDGTQYTSTGTTYSTQGGTLTFTTDISKAYPAAASVSRWQRTFVFNTTQDQLTLDDRFNLTSTGDTTEINFLTSCSVRNTSSGVVVFTDALGKDILKLTFDPTLMQVVTKVKQMDDATLKNSWGDHLTRVSCVVNGGQQSADCHFVFSIP